MEENQDQFESDVIYDLCLQGVNRRKVRVGLLVCVHGPLTLVPYWVRSRL